MLIGAIYVVLRILVDVLLFFFIFSGETEENRLGIIQGQADVPLNDTGRQQARLAAEKLACETFTSVYSSDLIRVKEVFTPSIKRGPICTLCADPPKFLVEICTKVHLSFPEISGIASKCSGMSRFPNPEHLRTSYGNHGHLYGNETCTHTPHNLALSVDCAIIK